MKTENLNYEEALYLADLFEQFNEMITFENFLDEYLNALIEQEKYEDAAFLKHILKKVNNNG